MGVMYLRRGKEHEQEGMGKEGRSDTTKRHAEGALDYTTQPNTITKTRHRIQKAPFSDVHTVHFTFTSHLEVYLSLPPAELGR
jgi:hypothetical protein